jgi:hypothetical protein
MTRAGVGQDIARLEEFNHLGQDVIGINVIGPGLRHWPQLAKMDIDGQIGFLADARRESHDLDTPARKTAQFGVCLDAFDEIGIFPGGAYRGLDVQAIGPVERRIGMPCEATDEIG